MSKRENEEAAAPVNGHSVVGAEDVLDLATARARLENADTQRLDHSDVLAALEDLGTTTGG